MSSIFEIRYKVDFFQTKWSAPCEVFVKTYKKELRQKFIERNVELNELELQNDKPKQ